MANIISPFEFFDDIAGELAKQIASYSPQIFCDRYKKISMPVYPECSSVLIAIDERYFLITAGHCVHDVDVRSIGIMIENDFLTIGGDMQYFQANTATFYEPNNLDVAIYELDNKAVDAIKEKYKFLPAEYLETKHESPEISRYLIFGYPESKTSRHQPTKTITPIAVVIRTIGIARSFYISQKIEYDKILILRADGNGTNATDISVLPHLEGMSGCGIWKVAYPFDRYPQYKLVSILTGQDDQKSFLYSARIDYLKALFQSYFGVNSF